MQLSDAQLWLKIRSLNSLNHEIFETLYADSMCVRLEPTRIRGSDSKCSQMVKNAQIDAPSSHLQ